MLAPPVGRAKARTKTQVTRQGTSSEWKRQYSLFYSLRTTWQLTQTYKQEQIFRNEMMEFTKNRTDNKQQEHGFLWLH